MLCGFRGLPSSEGSGFSHCWRQWYQTWWTNRLIQYGNSSVPCVFQTGFCVHMPERWFFSCSGRPSWVETGRIKHFGWVCVWICICVQRETDIKQLITAVCFLCFGFNPVWDSPPLTLIPAFHSMLRKLAGFWLFQFVLRVKTRVGRWVFVLWMIISLTKIQVQGKLHQHFSRLQTWHLILFFFFSSALKMRNLQY